MTAKQQKGSTAPDGSQYVVITDGGGNLGESGVPIGAVTQSGTWTVQPGNTANTTPWLVTEADGGNATLGAKADAKSTATDTTSISVMSVLKQISASAQAPPSQAVTNVGTFVVQASRDASVVAGGIPSTARLLSATGSSGDATNVKGSAGRLYAIQGVNVATSARYLKLYNASSAPTAGSGTPVKTLYLPASSAFAFDWAQGLAFSAGIGYTLVTGSADNSSTSVTAADILALNLDYA